MSLLPGDRTFLHKVLREYVPDITGVPYEVPGRSGLEAER